MEDIFKDMFFGATTLYVTFDDNDKQKNIMELYQKVYKVAIKLVRAKYPESQMQAKLVINEEKEEIVISYYDDITLFSLGTFVGIVAT